MSDLKSAQNAQPDTDKEIEEPELTELQDLILRIVAATNDRGISKQGIGNVVDLIAEQVAAARIDTVDSALKACPTKDHMLRLWLEQHLAWLKKGQK